MKQSEMVIANSSFINEEKKAGRTECWLQEFPHPEKVNVRKANGFLAFVSKRVIFTSAPPKN